MRAASQETAQVRRTAAAGPPMDSRLGRAAKRRRQARAASRRQSGKAQGDGEAADQDDQDDEHRAAAALQQETEGYETDREQQDADRDLSKAPKGLETSQGEHPQADLGGIPTVDFETLRETAGRRPVGNGGPGLGHRLR